MNMNTKQIKNRLERNLHLEMSIEQSRFLTGYTKGGQKGALISIFVCHSPFLWTTNCIKAKACEYIDAGEVIVVSDDWPWSIPGKWKAYSPNHDKQLVKFARSQFPKERFELN